jgi:hypothetical protein
MSSTIRKRVKYGISLVHKLPLLLCSSKVIKYGEEGET